jgi:hypothetical protein
LETEKFKLADLLYGLVIPIIVGLLIVAFPAVIRPALDGFFPPGNLMTGAGASPYAFLTAIFTHGFALMVLFAIPMILGLIWNKWAGGAAGFIMGTLLYLGEAGYNVMFTINNYGGSSPNLYADPSFIGNYIVGGVLIGYISGGLCKGSPNFKRMLGAGLIAAITVGILQFGLNMTVSFAKFMSQANPPYALFLSLLPMIILGIIGPIVAIVMTWYGLQPVRQH